MDSVIAAPLSTINFKEVLGGIYNLENIEPFVPG